MARIARIAVIAVISLLVVVVWWLVWALAFGFGAALPGDGDWFRTALLFGLIVAGAYMIERDLRP
ncbi:MAG: hypothetical protein ACK4RV_10305 [Caulobacter sp.]